VNADTTNRVPRPCALPLMVAGALIWALPGLSAAQSLSAPSLSDVYRKALVQDAQYLAARKTLQAALEKLPQARATLLPGLSLNATQGQQSGIASFSNAPWIERTPATWAWTLQLTQPLLHPASWSGYQQAGRQMAQAQAQLEQAQQELMLRCAQGYLEVLVASESVRVMDAQLAAMAAQLALTERNFEVGTGTITDVHEARARHALTQSQRVAAASELAARQAELERLLGEPLTLPALQLSADLPALTQPQDNWRAAALKSNPQIRALEAALEGAQLETVKNQRAHWPTLDLNASMGTNYSSGSLGSPADLSSRVESHSLGLQLTVPLFAGGATQSRVREALALQEKAAAELLSTQRAVQMQVQQAYLGVSSAQAQAQALQVAVQAGQNAVQGNLIGFRIGTRVNPEVLNAQQQLFASMRDLSKARTDTALQGLRLKAAAGQLRIEDLGALDLVLKPVAPTP
jgi:outer membrane protein